MSPRIGKSGVKYLQFEKGKYWVYSHPAYVADKGKPYYFSAETTKAEAVKYAREANLHYSGCLNVITGQDKIFLDAVNRYEKEYLPTKKLAKGTLSNVINRLTRLKSDCGEWVTDRVTVRQVSDYLDDNYANDAYIKHRGTLIDIFKFAIAKGLADNNPASQTFAKSTKKHMQKQRKRLTIDAYKQIHLVAPMWLRNAMDLSLITLQARNEVCSMMFDDIKDGYLHVVRQKTAKKTERAYIKIEISPSLSHLIARCRDDIASRYLVHRRPEKRYRGKKRDWAQVLPEYLSKGFAKCRDSIDEFRNTKPEERPTFHEIRALGADRYIEAGHSKEYVNLLLGHTKMAMTEHYLDGHGVRWTEAKADMLL